MKLAQWQNFRHMGPAALLCRAERNFAPAFDALGEFILVELWYGKARCKRQYRCDAKFGRLLDDEVHFLALGEAEGQVQFQRRLSTRFIRPANLESSLIVVQTANHRFMFPAGVIEQRHDI